MRVPLGTSTTFFWRHARTPWYKYKCFTRVCAYPSVQLLKILQFGFKSSIFSKKQHTSKKIDSICSDRTKNIKKISYEKCIALLTRNFGRNSMKILIQSANLKLKFYARTPQYNFLLLECLCAYPLVRVQLFFRGVRA